MCFFTWSYGTFIWPSLVKSSTGNEVQKQLPGRPSAPSAEVVARAWSKTVESLEDNDSDTPSETSGEYGKIL